VGARGDVEQEDYLSAALTLENVLVRFDPKPAIDNGDDGDRDTGGNSNNSYCPSRKPVAATYLLTVDELLSWQSSLDQHGLAGLRTTRIQKYRM